MTGIAAAKKNKFMEYIHYSTAYTTMVVPENGLGGLPLVAVLIRLVPDAPFAAEELDAVLSNQLPAAHQPAMGSLFLTGLHLFLAHNAQVVAQHVENASFADGLASKPGARHAAVLLIAGCGRAPIAKSLPYLQCLGCCQMHWLKTYTR